MTEEYRVTARGQRTSAAAEETWEAGEYVLLAGRYTPPQMEGVGAAERVRGDDLTLDEIEATRLGNAGAIAPPDSEAAARAREGRGTPSSQVKT